MEYMVVGSDGQEYGPANVDALKQWAQEKRLEPTTTLKDFATGRTMAASSVPGIFPDSNSMPPPAAVDQTNWSQPPSPYPRGGTQSYYGQDSGSKDVWGALIRSALALVLFFVLHGIGLIFAVYALMSSIRALQKGHKLGVVAVVISSVTLVAVAIGWFLRLQSGGGF